MRLRSYSLAFSFDSVDEATLRYKRSSDSDSGFVAYNANVNFPNTWPSVFYLLSKIIIITSRFTILKNDATAKGAKLFRLKYGNKNVNIFGYVMLAMGNGGGTAVNINLAIDTDATTGYKYICNSPQRAIPSNYVNNSNTEYMIYLNTALPYELTN